VGDAPAQGSGFWSYICSFCFLTIGAAVQRRIILCAGNGVLQRTQTCARVLVPWGWGCDGEGRRVTVLSEVR